MQKDAVNKEIMQNVLRKAKSLGAHHVDIIFCESDTSSAETRLAQLKKFVHANVVSIKIRVSIGKKNAIIATDNLKELQDDSFVEKAVSAAKIAPEDAFYIRPDIDQLCKNIRVIDTCDDTVISRDKLVEDAKTCESIALGVNGITNSEGAEASHTRSKIILFGDEDFVEEYEKTVNQISVVTLAEKSGNLEMGYDFSKAVYYSDLKDLETIAKKAAKQALRKLGARKISSCKVPVIFDKRVAGHLLSSLLDALSGAQVAKGMSFLKDQLSKKVFSDCLSITDRYALERGLRSRPFDSDGLECKDNSIIKNGTLNSFLLNTKYAHQLQMKSTCNAYGFDGIAPNNVYMEEGKCSFDDLVKSVKNGLYITEVLGNGLNVVTGNYSQGAVGFWIEGGEIAYPVNEITVAGNFIDMFGNCEIASDLKMETGIDSPALLMPEMTIGGV
jgi:PmbA protein